MAVSSQWRILIYNFGNLWRRLVLPKRIDAWSLPSLQQRLVKTRARLVKHARYYWLLLAESQPDSTPVRGDAAADLGPAGADRLTCDGRYGARVAKSGRHTGEVSEQCPRTRSLPARVTAAKLAFEPVVDGHLFQTAYGRGGRNGAHMGGRPSATACADTIQRPCANIRLVSMDCGRCHSRPFFTSGTVGLIASSLFHLHCGLNPIATAGRGC